MKSIKFHAIAISASLLLGAGLGAVQPGEFLVGWFVFSILFLFTFYIFRLIHFWIKGNAVITILLGAAFLLRLALGVGLNLALPAGGNPNEQHDAGYIFLDSYRRDAQAWQLAESGDPILTAFNKNFYSDQYGGLLAFNALLYRHLSPDAHRPLLPVFFGALTAALGVVFLWKAALKQWDEQIAMAAVCLYAFYPESIFLGSAQMREPFLMSFVTMTLWGYVDRASGWKSAGLWVALGFSGMLLVSPAVALLMMVVLAGWAWMGNEHARLSWTVAVIAGLVFIAGLYLLAWGLEREQSFGSSPLGIILDWSRAAVKWDTYQLVRDSGWVQKLFNEMPEALHPPFVMIYGITQPVLPATFIEPTTPLLRTLMVLRALGWYVLVPLLFYATFAVSRLPASAAKRLWFWLTVITWIWIIIAALRGGADQWDNPRYRAFLIAIQALVAGFAWVNRGRWLMRWLAVEAVFLLVFTQWYISRYYHIGGQLPFGIMILLILLIAAAILAGGWWRDRHRQPPPSTRWKDR